MLRNALPPRLSRVKKVEDCHRVFYRNRQGEEEEIYL